LKELNLIQPSTSKLFSFLSVGRTYKEIEAHQNVTKGYIFKRLAVLVNLGLAESKKVNDKTIYYQCDPEIDDDTMKAIINLIVSRNKIIKYTINDFRRVEYGTAIREHISDLAFKMGDTMMQGITAKAEFDRNNLRREVMQIAMMFSKAYAKASRGKRRFYLKRVPEESKAWKAFVKMLDMLRLNGVTSRQNKEMFVEALFHHYSWKDKNGNRIYPFPQMCSGEKAFAVYKEYLKTKSEMYLGKVRLQASEHTEVQNKIVDTAVNLYNTYIEIEAGNMEEAIDWAVKFGIVSDMYAMATTHQIPCTEKLRTKFQRRWNKVDLSTCIELALPKAKKEVHEYLRQRYKGRVREEVFNAIW